nr:MAG TPA: hypothetical protein [Caudoviricetes sp.]
MRNLQNLARKDKKGGEFSPLKPYKGKIIITLP